MQIIRPNSSAVSEIAFDPDATTGDVLVQFKDGGSTYRYGPWPLAGIKQALTGNRSLGAEIARLRKTESQSFNEFKGDCANAIRLLNLSTRVAPSPRLNSDASALLAF